MNAGFTLLANGAVSFQMMSRRIQPLEVSNRFGPFFFSPRSLIYAEYNLRFYHLFPSFAHPHKTLINFSLHQTHNRKPSHPDAILLFQRPDPTSEHIQIAANITELHSNILPG